MLALVTEWPDYAHPDFAHIHQTLQYPAVFDGRNFYSPEVVAEFGLSYFGIGRGVKVIDK